MSARPPAVVHATRLFLLLMTSASLAACSKGSTILAVTVSSGSNLMAMESMIKQVRIRVTPSSGAVVEQTFDAPQTTILVDGGPEAGGSEFSAVTASFFERLDMGGVSGPATVRADAFQAGATSATGVAWNEAPVDIVAHEGNAVQVMLIVGGPPPPVPDGGADAASDGAAGGSDGGEDSPSDAAGGG